MELNIAGFRAYTGEGRGAFIEMPRSLHISSSQMVFDLVTGSTRMISPALHQKKRKHGSTR